MRHEGKYVFLIVALAIIVSLFFHYTSPHLAFRTPVHIAGHELDAKIATDDATRMQGFSGHPKLFLKEAILFIFDSAGQPGFWMKDMNFPIDIIWIGENKKVVGFTENLTPDTYPQAFYPPSDVKYVLEVYSGFVVNNHIKVGDELSY